MYNNKADLEIGQEVPVYFNGIYYSSGVSKKGPWSRLEIRFGGFNGGKLTDQMWNITEQDDIERIFLNTKLYQLGLAISGGEDIWNNYQRNPLVRNSYTKVFSNILKSFNEFKGSTIYVKTIVRGQDEDGSFESMLPDRELLMLDDNVIFSHEKGVLQYNELELNNLDSYDYEFEPPKRLNQIPTERVIVEPIQKMPKINLNDPDEFPF